MSSGLVSELHQKLAGSFKNWLVLLGGSHFFKEETQDSDIDFYLLLPWWQMFNYKKIKIKLKKILTTVNNAHCMLVVTVFNKPLSLYYIKGVDINNRVCGYGSTHRFIRNSIKMALFNYLRSQVLTDNAWRNFKKSFKQLATHQILQNSPQTRGDLFSFQFINDNKDKLSPRLANILPDLQNQNPPPNFFTLKPLLLQELLISAKKFLGQEKFSLSTYFTFNILMFFRRRKLILNADPDIIVTAQLVDALTNSTDLNIHYEQINQTILPVIII